jgi:hypothetical protein
MRVALHPTLLLGGMGINTTLSTTARGQQCDVVMVRRLCAWSFGTGLPGPLRTACCKAVSNVSAALRVSPGGKAASVWSQLYDDPRPRST